jgi:hypothetical protein
MGVKCGMRVFQNSGEENIVPKREEVTEGCRKCYNEHDLYTSTDIHVLTSTKN